MELCLLHAFFHVSKYSVFLERSPWCVCVLPPCHRRWLQLVFRIASSGVKLRDNMGREVGIGRGDALLSAEQFSMLPYLTVIDFTRPSLITLQLFENNCNKTPLSPNRRGHHRCCVFSTCLHMSPVFTERDYLWLSMQRVSNPHQVVMMRACQHENIAQLLGVFQVADGSSGWWGLDRTLETLNTSGF